MRVAIITGASSGIGQSAAVQLAKRGTGVIVTYHGNQSGSSTGRAVARANLPPFRMASSDVRHQST